MKTKVRLLNLLIKSGFIRPDDFYSITVNKDKITLQGYYVPEVILYYRSKRFDFKVWDNGYLSAKRKSIEIVLTDR